MPRSASSRCYPFALQLSALKFPIYTCVYAMCSIFDEMLREQTIMDLLLSELKRWLVGNHKKDGQSKRKKERDAGKDAAYLIKSILGTSTDGEGKRKREMQVLHQILQPCRQWYHQPRQATVDAGRCQRQGLVVFNLLLYAAVSDPGHGRTAPTEAPLSLRRL